MFNDAQEVGVYMTRFVMDMNTITDSPIDKLNKTDKKLLVIMIK